MLRLSAPAVHAVLIPALRHPLLQHTTSAARPRRCSSRCSLMLTRLDSSIELRLPSISFTVYSRKRLISWPTYTASILFTHSKSTPIFTDLFRPSLQLLLQQFLSLPPLPPVIRLLRPPSNMHHHSVPFHKHPQLLPLTTQEETRSSTTPQRRC